MTTQIAGFDAAVNAGWNGSSYPYLNAPHLAAASSGQYTKLLGSTFYTYAVIPQLDELKALGANAVTIHIDFPTFYQPFYTFIGNPAQYQQFVSFYQQLAQDVRSRGMKLVVEAGSPMPLAGNQFSAFQPYFQSLSWSDYMAGRAANALAVAQLIQPDYMTVLYEPDTEATATGQTTVNSVAGATQLVQQVLATLQQAGVKNIQVGAGAGTWIKNFMQYIQAFAGLPLNYVDLHIYPINKSFFTNALTAADAIHASGKQVGMSEFWDYKLRDSELGSSGYGGGLGYAAILARDPFSFWGPIDTSFLQAIVNFAKYKQLAFISPFGTQYFFNYLDYNTYGSQPVNTVLTTADTASSNAILAGAFTPTGHAWESQNIPRDTTPPATPAAPTALVIGTTGLNLVWTPVNDNVGVSAYNLYRNGSLLSTTSMPLYYDSGLVSGATYTYKLTATDASGNVSPISAPLVVQTVNITPPSVPTNLVVTSVVPGIPGSVSLNWKLSTGIGGVGGYYVLRGTSPGAMSIHANIPAPPFTDPYASPSTTYYYQVKSYNPLGVQSGPSNQVTVATPGPPSVPTNLVVTGNVPGSVSLNWTPSTGVGGVGGYYLLRGTSPTSMSIHAKITAPPPYTDPYASLSTTYYYEVQSFSPDGVTSGPSNQVTVVTPAPPSAPTSLVVTGIVPGSVSLNWTPSTGTGGVGGYRVLRGTSPASLSIHADIPAPPYTDPYAQLSTTYYYQVESYSPLGVKSGTSNQVTVTTPAPPSVPTNLVVTGNVPGSLSLNWTPSGSVGGYYILRGTSPGSMSIHGQVATPPYTDASASLATTYYYQVKSYNSLGVLSGPSNEVTVTTPPLPSVPANLVVTSVVPGAPGSVSLNWTPSPGLGAVGGYRILRGTSPTSMSIHAQLAAPPYTDPYATPNTTYYYQVESYELGITSGPSNEVTVTTPAK